jgi:tetratricopeptide (TPR) repeat protein
MRRTRLLPAFLAAFATLSAAAQDTGSLSGVVRDGSGNALGNVSVTIAGKQIPAYSRQTASDETGAYRFADIAGGDYVVTAAFSGYEPAVSPVIHVPAAPAMATANLVMTRGSAASNTPKLQLQASGLHGLIDPGGYSASAGAAAASGVVSGIAAIKRADGSFEPSDGKLWPCDLEPGLRKAVEEHPEQGATNRRLGQFYVAHEQPSKAVPLLTRALQIDSTDEVASQALATAWLQSGKFDEARTLLVPLAARRNLPELHRHLARADEGLGMFQQAAQQYQEANSEQPSEDNLFGAGYELVLAASLTDALKVFELGQRRYTRSLAMWIGDGAVQILMGHTAAGVQAFLQASDLSPSDSRPYALLASVSGIAKEESELVRVCFKGYVEREPRNAYANYFYGVSLSQEDGAARNLAESYLKRAIELDPGLAKAHLALANLESAAKKYDDAVREYEAAVRLEPGLSEAHYRLALAYKRAGRAEPSAREMQIFQQDTSEQTASRAGIDVTQFISAFDTPQEKSGESQCATSPH